MRGSAQVILMAFLAAALATAAAPAMAMNAAAIDIIGLRLGMLRTEVIDTLHRQGFTVSATSDSISVATRDGHVDISLAPDQTARSIRYTFLARAPREAEVIANAMIERWGPPDQANPPTWCAAPLPGAICPDTTASLTYQPNTHTLLLDAGSPGRK